MKIMVTGATGFVGGHLVRYLSNKGHDIVAPVRSSEQLSDLDIPLLTGCDFSDAAWMVNEMRDVDAVVHAAAYAHQTRVTSEIDREIFQATNVDLSVRLFRASREAAVSQFVFISSIGAIRSSSEGIVTERTPPAPDSDYARSKLAAERQLSELAVSGDTALTILRPCLVYGKGNPGNLQRLAALIDRNIPLPFKSLSSRRSFLFVENLIDAIAVSLLDRRTYGEDFIVSDDEAMTVPQLIDAISDVRGRPTKMFGVPQGLLVLLGRLGDVVKAVTGLSVGVDSYSVERLSTGLECDNTKFKAKLDWRPPYSTREGIGRTFNGSS